MSQFTSPLCVEKIDQDVWRLLEPLWYESDLLECTVIVPKGFSTDFASVPRKLPVAWWIGGGIADQSATVHDWLYRHPSDATRKMVDDVFHEAMAVEGVSRWRRGLMWAGVRVGALWTWRRYRAED